MKNWILAARSLRRRPGFTLAAVAILALGIGAITTLFSVVDSVLIKPLPYPNADRLVTLLEASPVKGSRDSLIAPARLEDWNRMSRTFEAISSHYSENVTDTSGSEPERLSARRVTPRYFSVWGAAPITGRTFSVEEELTGGPAAAVISYGLWTRRYAQDPNVLGKRLLIGGRGYTIVGVMPKEFASTALDAWLPAQMAPGLMQVREARFVTGVGRMRPGVTIAQATEDLARVQRQLGEQYPKTDAGWSALVNDLKEGRIGDYRQTLWIIFGAVGLLLLMAVANIGGLMLAQLHQRERELAIRASIGASRRRLIATLLRESMVLAIAGGAAGATIAFWAVPLIASSFTTLPRASELHVDTRTLVFSAMISIAAAILFGLLPAIKSSGVTLSLLVTQSSRSVAGGRSRWQQSMVVVQIAITVLLLASAGLLLRSYYNLSHVDAGIDTSNTITFHVGAAWDEDRARVGHLQEQLIAELERMPGVEAAGMANFLPASGATLRYHAEIEGMNRSEDGGKIPTGSRTVSAGYLKTLKIPLVAGEWCPALRFDFSAPPKALVNRRFVEMYGGGSNLIGRHFQLTELQGPQKMPPMEIIGVVGDVHEDGFAAAPAPYFYSCAMAGGWPDPEYVVRTQGSPRAVMQSIRQVVHSLDSSRAVFGVRPLDRVIGAALDQPRLNAEVLGLFAGMALLLACVGLYGLVALVVASRTREIGVRMALGAAPGRILRSVFADAARLLGIGAAAGIVLTYAAQRLLKTLLFGVSPADVPTILGTIGALALVAIVAAYLPARRAAAVDPVEAMRAE
jgi:predicted permease